MKKLTGIIQTVPKYKQYDSFEDFCINENKNPGVPSELDFFKYTFFGFKTYNKYVENIYERLGESLSADYIYTQLLKLFPETSDHVNIFSRDTNIIVKFKAKHGFNDNNQFIQLLNRCNWYISSIREEGNDRVTGLITYNIEPKKPSNYTDYIYNECNGCIYKIINKRKLQKILKYGLNPTKTIDISDNQNYRTYFLANTTNVLVKKDIESTIREIQVFNDNRLQLGIIKIDLNKLQKTHDITIQAFIDPRMETKCYWTAEFIPASCITDVTSEFSL